MQVTITIKAEASDALVADDAVTALESLLPYMFDNVVVTADVGVLCYMLHCNNIALPGRLGCAIHPHADDD
jgi:hypothetical protein